MHDLAHDRDQLFAEALAAWKAGAKWWPDGDFEREYIAPQQEARFEVDAWEERIAEWLSGRQKCTLMEVAREGLFIDMPRLGTVDQRRIAAALERLGWERGARSGAKGERTWQKRQAAEGR